MGHRDKLWIMAAESDEVSARLIDLLALLLGAEGIDGFLEGLAVLAVHTLGEDLSCGITFRTNGSPLTVVSSDMLAAQVDEVQYDLRRGPCLSALRTGRLVRIDDLAADKRWRAYGMRALGYGVRSSLSLPLTACGRPVGALNLYSRLPWSFGSVETRHAQRFADEASMAVGVAARLSAPVVLIDELRASLASRSVIDQALGVIMAERRCTTEGAFAALRAVSQRHSVELDEVARDIVAVATGKLRHSRPFDQRRPRWLRVRGQSPQPEDGGRTCQRMTPSMPISLIT